MNLWPGEACLVSELAEEVSQFGKFSLQDIVIVFPTQRLEVYFLAKLANFFPAFPKPRIFSFEHFVEEFLETGDVKESIVSDLACELVLVSLIKEKRYKSIMVGDEHEVKQFFGEMLEAGLEDTCFDKMKEVFEEDIYSSEAHLELMDLKINELKDLYNQFTQVLESKNLCLKDLYYRKAVTVLKDKWDKKEKLPWKHLYFVGFTTLRSDFVSLAQELLSFETVSFWLTKAPCLLSEVNPLKNLEEKFLGSRVNRLCQTQKKAIRPVSFIKQASTPMAEVVEAFALAKNYCDKGLSPSQIGILVSCETTYGNLVRVVFEEEELKANIAVSVKLSQTLLGSWLSNFMSLARGGEKKEDILDFLINPLTFCVLKSLDKEDILSQEKLSFLVIKSRETRGFEKILESLEEVEVSSLLLVFYQSIKAFCDPFSYKSVEKSLKEWALLIDDIFHFFKVYSFEFVKEAGLSNSITTSAYQFIDALTLAHKCYNPLIKSEEIGEFFHKKLLGLEVRDVGYPLEGLQILRLIESRYIPFEVVIILGCVEGKFPKKLPKDYILDNWFKKRIGFRGWEYVESLEDTTFHLLKSRIKVLELFYSVTDKGRQTVPSRFLEIEKSYCAKEAKVLTTEWSSFFAKSKAFSSRGEEQFLAEASGFFTDVSAKSASFLLNCPYKFLLYSLKVEPEHFFRKTDHLEEGKVLHEILEIFYKGCFKEELTLSQLAHEVKTEELYETLYKRLELITKSLFEKSLSKMILYHLLTYSWPKFIHFFMKFYKKGFGDYSKLVFSSSFRELSFGGKFSDIKTPSLCYQNEKGEEDKVFLRGSIDSLDKSKEAFLLMDYKRKTVPKQKDQDSFRDIQLLFYSLVYSLSFDSDLEKGLSGYWSIMEGKWHPRSIGVGFEEIEGISDSKSLKKKSIREGTQKFQEKLLASLVSYKKESAYFEKIPGSHCDRCDYFDFCQPESK